MKYIFLLPLFLFISCVAYSPAYIGEKQQQYNSVEHPRTEVYAQYTNEIVYRTCYLQYNGSQYYCAYQYYTFKDGVCTAITNTPNNC